MAVASDQDSAGPSDSQPAQIKPGGNVKDDEDVSVENSSDAEESNDTIEVCQCSQDAFERRAERMRQEQAPDSGDSYEATGIGIRWYSSPDEKWFVADIAEYDQKYGAPKPDDHSDYALVIRGSGESEEIEILSDYIQRVIRSQLSYTPDTSYDGRMIVMGWPYSTLFFHLDGLNDYVKANATNSEQEEFDKLNNFYNRRAKAYHEEVRLSLTDSNVRFANLWAVFEPGTLLYKLDEFEQPRLFMIGASATRRPKIEDFSELMLKPSSSRLTIRFCVDAWSISWDQSKREFSRDFTTFTIPEYPGLKDVTSFPVYPVRYWNGSDDDKNHDLMKRLESRGRAWKEYMGEKPSCHQYSGPAIELKPVMMSSKSKKSQRIHLHDRIIVDSEEMVVTAPLIPGMSMPELGEPMDNMFSMMSVLNGTGAEIRVQAGSMTDEYSDFDSHPANKDFTPLQARLCPATVCAMSLFDKNGYHVAMSYIGEVEWTDEPFHGLVLDPERKETLRGLVDQHAKNKARVRGDFIEGKGRGLIMVLHGPPGVGKTLTAEALAEHTRKPLFSVNVGELTLDNLGNRFRDVFKKATRWDAVLLIDEADVLLEKRSYENLTRNGLVSVFLRMLEYYEGLLFLTTNRLTTIDPAFHSRIQIAIDYPALQPPTRLKIWQNFIQRLHVDEKKARQELTDRLDDISHWPLNGREIRNVMLLAQSLAWNQERRVGALRFSHVERVARETLQFHEIFQTAEYDSKARLGQGISSSNVGGGGGNSRAWPSR